MAGYSTRQSTYTTGDVIAAADTNDEFNQLISAFNASTGHTHDGTAGDGGPVSVLRDSNAYNRILLDTSNNHLEFYVNVSSSSVQQLRIEDGAIVPITDNDIDLGTASLEFKNLYIDGTANVDALAMPTTTVTDILDEDTMSSDSATALATQQSIKAYVDSQVTAQDLDFQADTGGALSIDLDSETLTLTGGTGIDTTGALNTVTFAIDNTVVATLTDTQTLTNKTLTSPVISSISNTGTITLPTSTDTLVGRATTDTLTNKTIDANGTGNSITNLEVADLASGVLDTDLTSVSASDDTLASAKAIKSYVDTQVATANELSELTDVNITTPADGSLLFYDTGTSKWIDNVVSGDITIADTGVAAIGSGVIVNADINASAAIDATKIHDGSISNTEFGYLNGVTSDIQTQINAKEDTITGAATTITSSDLTASRALISNGSGKVAVSTVTDTELGYLSGVTSNIQTQIDSAASAGFAVAMAIAL